MKKFNRKHNLEIWQELEARKIRRVLLEEKSDEENVEERVKKLYELFVKDKPENVNSFYDYIKKQDVVLFSAFERIGGSEKLSSYITKKNIIC